MPVNSTDRVAVAVKLFDAELASLSKAARLAKLSIEEFLDRLGEQNVVAGSCEKIGTGSRALNNPCVISNVYDRACLSQHFPGRIRSTN
jgi:hypothetical protein